MRQYANSSEGTGTGTGDYLFRKLVEQSAQGVLVHRDLRPLYANAACARLLGFPDGRSLCESAILETLFVNGALFAREARQVAQGSYAAGSRNFVARVRRSDTTDLWLDIMMQPIEWPGGPAVSCTLVDVTERRRMEERARRLQYKLVDTARESAVREVSDALLHQLNQPRTAITNYANAAKRMIARNAPPEKVVETIDQILKETVRAGELLEALRTNARPDEGALADMEPIVAEVVSAVGAEAKAKRIPIQVEVPPGLPPLRASGRQIYQVVLNLVSHAIDVLPEDAERGLLLSARMVGSNIGLDIAHSGRSARRLASLQTRGTGTRIDLCEAILESQGGQIAVIEDGYGGLRFRMLLPVAPGAVSHV